MGEPQQLPQFFIDELKETYCSEDVQRIVAGCSVQRATTLRANALKTNAQNIADELSAAGIDYKRCNWYSDAFILPYGSISQVRELAAFESGELYLQSLSSMLPPLALRAQAGLDVLDMCAAPGGKTTQIAALTGGAAHITACEMHAPRAEKLKFNLERQGAKNVMVMQQDARRLDSFFSFDRVLLDAPCSGSGTLSCFDPKMPKRFTEQLVAKTCKQQHALLQKALEVVKPGGFVLYSTCSVLKRENEQVVQDCLKRAKKSGSYKLVDITIDGLNAYELQCDFDEAICICPDENFEGFFMALVERVA